MKLPKEILEKLDPYISKSDHKICFVCGICKTQIDECYLCSFECPMDGEAFDERPLTKVSYVAVVIQEEEFNASYSGV